METSDLFSVVLSNDIYKLIDKYEKKHYKDCKEDSCGFGENVIDALSYVMAYILFRAVQEEHFAVATNDVRNHLMELIKSYKESSESINKQSFH